MYSWVWHSIAGVIRSKILTFLLVSYLFCAEGIELNNINATWQKVLPGTLVCEPQTTSYGFVVMTDAQNLMGFKSSGEIIFERTLSNAYKAFFSVLNDDFLAVITNSGSKLSLINPDGNTLWSTFVDYKITSAPLSGRDGRFFVQGANNLSCFGITGIQKWEIETPAQSSLGLKELTDGTIVLFLSETDAGKTVALRITPFGEIIEKITFAGLVSKALTTPKGILLTFTDGSCGLFDLENNVSTHKWLLKKDTSQKSNKDFFILSQNKENIVYVNQKTNSVEIDYINLENGSVEKSFFITDISMPENGWYNSSGIILTDNKNASFYNNLGRYLWSGFIPAKTQKSQPSVVYTSFTTDNCFVVFRDDWSVQAFKTASITDKKANLVQKSKYYNYNNFYNIDTSLLEIEFPLPIDSEIISEQKFIELNEGNYGIKEIDYASTLLSACTYYKSILTSGGFTERSNQSVFQTDTTGMEKLLTQMSFYSSDLFADFTAVYLKNETNRTYIHTLLQGIVRNGYDPDKKIIQALEYLLRKTSDKDDVILCDICDAVYSISKFMGSASIDPIGKDILTSLLYPKYKSTTRDYARNTLKKLVGN